jgi:hypothetical protein
MPTVSPWHNDRIRKGAAVCAICRRAIRPSDDAVLTPDFLANDADPLFAFSDAALHQPCFIVWERRKIFIARYNQVARQLVDEDGSYPHMTSEGNIVRRSARRRRSRRPEA